MVKRRWHSPEARRLILVTGLTDPVVAITTLAQELLDELGMDEPPFNPNILASLRHILEIRQVEMASAARLIPENNYLVIEVNKHHPLVKQNFSADHEVAHTLFPTYSGTYIDDLETGSFSSSSEEEFLCDVGAATLLLDPRALAPRARQMGASLNSMFHLAGLFDASLQATAHQLASVDVWPCAFVFWEPGLRKAEELPPGQTFLPGLEELAAPQEKWRVKHPYVSPSFGQYPSRNKSVKESSLVAQVQEHGGFTVGTEIFNLGSEEVSLYCQNVFAPYRSGGVTQPRVISILLPSERLAEGERGLTLPQFTFSS